MSEFMNVEIQAGESVSIGEHTVTPFAQSVQIRFPGMGGFIWNRPVSVLVQNKDGEEEVLPIIDVTRQALFGFIGLGLFTFALTWILKRISRKT